MRKSQRMRLKTRAVSTPSSDWINLKVKIDHTDDTRTRWLKLAYRHTPWSR